MEKVYNSYNNVLKTAKKAADILDHMDSDIEAIKYPERGLRITIPVRMDDGTTKVLEGYRVQYSISRGPVKGGVRFRLTVNPDEVRVLAVWMIFKCVVVNISYSNGKDGVVRDPNELSENGIQIITRRYTATITPPTGSEQDIPASDIGINTSIMSWMIDTYSMLKGRYIHGVATGRLTRLGGALGRDETIRRGVTYITKNIPNKMEIPTEETTVAIQGMGSVGSITAKLPHREGMKIVAVNDISSGIYNPDGLSVLTILNYLSLNGKNLLKGYNEEGMSRIINEELPEMDVRILVPAALENQISTSNARKIRTEIIAEAVNGSAAVDTDGVLQDGGITVVPDTLADVGGVVVSYFEWVQNTQSVSWTEEEVSEKLKNIMDPTFEAAWGIVMKQSATLCTGVYLIVAKRVVEAKAVRVTWP